MCLTPSCLLVADLPKVCRAANNERERESTRFENTRRALEFSTSSNFISCVLDSLVFARGRPSKGRLTREFFTPKRYHVHLGRHFLFKLGFEIGSDRVEPPPHTPRVVQSGSPEPGYMLHHDDDYVYATKHMSPPGLRQRLG